MWEARIIVTLVAALALGCGEGAPIRQAGTEERLSFLLLTLDTTRADHLEPYGAEPGSTPALAELARRGVVFEHAYAVSPLTLPTHATLLTGLYPPQHGLRNNGMHALAEDLPTLAEGFRDRGYRTGAFVSAAVLERRYGLDQGFETFDDDMQGEASPADRMVAERPAGVTVDAARGWLDQLDADAPFFLWVHLFDPHATYAAPPPWGERYAERPYAGEIAYMDAEIGRLLDHPRLAHDDVATAAIGDHGESLGAHGERTHGLLAYDATLRIPFLLHLPGAGEPRRVAEPVSQIDLVPTVTALFGLELETAAPLPGKNLLAGLEPGAKTPERELYAESYLPFFAYGWSPLRALRRGAWKYIEAPQEELYDLAADPDETQNLAARDPKRAKTLARNLRQTVAKLGDATPRTVAPPDAEAVAKLESLGYVTATSGAAGGDRVRLDPKDVIDIHHLLQQAEGLISERRFALAEALLLRVQDRDPTNLKALQDLAQTCYEQGRVDDAITVLEDALGYAPGDPSLNLSLARLEAGRANPKRALELARIGRRFDPRALEPWLLEAEILDRLGRVPEIVALYDEARRHLAGEPRLHEQIGLLLARRQNPAAETPLRAALELDSASRPDLRNVLGDLLAVLGRSEEAQTQYEHALGGEATSLELANDRAQALVRIGKIDEAEQIWLGLTRERPQDAGPFGNLAALAIQRQNWDDAQTYARRATELDPDSAAAWNNLAFALDELGQQEAALDAYARAIEADPAYWQARFNRGLLLNRRTQFRQAAKAFEGVVRSHPDHVDAHYQLTLLYAGPLADPDRAQHHLRTLLELAPQHPRAPQLRQLLTRLEALSP